MTDHPATAAAPSGQPGHGAIRPRAARPREGRGWLRFLWLLVPAAVLLAPFLLILRGCEDGVKVKYGSRSSLEHEGDESINGVGAFSAMLQRAGHSVASTNRLTPRIATADVIVWFVQDFTPPSRQVTDWFDDWLEDRAGRTLVFVTRDYDAEPHYWSKVLPLASAQDTPVVQSRMALSATTFAGNRSPTTKPEDWHWFSFDRSATLKQRGVSTLTGDPAWTAGVDPTKVEIELNGRIQPDDPDDEVLLETPGDVIAFRRRYEPFFGSRDSQAIVVCNGSFLLNMSLINHEHRKLAGALIGELGDKKRVVFLESDGTPEVLASDPPPPRMNTSTMYFDVARTQHLLWHLAVLTLVICFGLFAIHGRARRLPPPPPSDFGRHAEALGDLLAQTKDAAYAQTKLAQYKNSTRADKSQRR